MKKKKRRLKKGIRRFLLAIWLIICLSIASFCGYKIYQIMSEDKKDTIMNEATKLDVLEIVEVEEKAEEKGKKYGELFKEMRTTNPDFRGWLVFDSGLINQAIVQSSDNEFYLTRRFTDMSYSGTGTAFMDYKANLNSKNIPIYGHHVAYNHSQMFTPLEQLLKEENYELNSTFSFYTETLRRDFEVVGVVIFDVNNHELLYDSVEFSEESFNNYINYIKNHNLYNINKEIKPSDKLITIQTCVEGQPDLRELVIGKEVSSKSMISGEDIVEELQDSQSNF